MVAFLCQPRTPTKQSDRLAAAEAKAILVWYVGLLSHCYREDGGGDLGFCPIRDGGGWVTESDEALVLQVLCMCGEGFNIARQRKLSGDAGTGNNLVGSCFGMFSFRKFSDREAALRAFASFKGMASALRKGAGTDDIRDCWLYKAPLEDCTKGPQVSPFSPLYLSPGEERAGV